MYNGVLEVPLPELCASMAYADDLALLTEEETVEEAKIRAQWAYDAIKDWTRAHGISREPSKTEALIVMGKKRPPWEH